MRLSEETRRLLDSFEEPSRFYLISESCGLQVRRFRNVLIGRHRNRMKPYEKQEQMFYHYSHSIAAGGLQAKRRLSFKTGVFDAIEPLKMTHRALWGENENSMP